MYRTHNCGQLCKENNDNKVVLSGWVFRRRDHGGLIFIDLRDRYGITQIVFDPEEVKSDLFAKAEALKNEFLITIEGKVRLRPEGQVNENLKTGEIEVLVESLELINSSPVLPFVIDRDDEVGEEIRLQYRYLDMRRERMRRNIITRAKVCKFIRDFLEKDDFLEIETPMMIKGTPEGSREYIIPSRIHTGNFYVLPQSPQQLKQLLMVAGMEKYFQIVRCFRDEDLRGDRQPEFTQLDMEMSFIDEEAILNLNERLALELTKKFRPDVKIQYTPFRRLTYKEAMDKYGSDKPDLRFEMEICDVSELVKNSEFSVFKDTVANGGFVKCLKVDGGGKYSRKDISDLEEQAKIYGAKGLAYIILEEDGSVRSPIAKFLNEDLIKNLASFSKAKSGDLMLFVADNYDIAAKSLGAVRLQVAKNENLIPSNVFAYAWVTDFPLFEKDEESGNLASAHHPFTAPKKGEEEKLATEPMNIIARAYDLVLNGSEIGGGSIRIHDQNLQSKIFETLGVGEKEKERKFGHILKALSYGAPPHGGIAWGLDRFLMILLDEPNIREVIPFPKDQRGRDLMLNAPSEVSEEQLKELGISIDDKKN